MQRKTTIRRIALITSQAFSLHNFRGPLIREWVARGLEVLALAPDYDESSRQAVIELGAQPIDFRMDRASIRPIHDARDTIRLTALLRRLRLDATFTYFIKPAIYGNVAARLAGIRQRYVLVEGAGYLFSEAGSRCTPLRIRLLRVITRWMYRIALRRADTVFFLNTDDMDMFMSQHIAAPAQSVLLGGIGVELDRFTPAKPVQAPVTFIMVARLLIPKGICEYVEAARRLRREYPSTRFVLLGSPDLNPASVRESQLVEWNASGLVEWQSHVADVRPWLGGASVFVLPSWYREGVPRSIQEAMAMGRPIVTTDMPGCRDTVADGVNGFLIPPRNVDALVEALRRFVLSPDLIVTMGRASRIRAEALFDVKRADRLILQRMRL